MAAENQVCGIRIPESKLDFDDDPFAEFAKSTGSGARNNPYPEFARRRKIAPIHPLTLAEALPASSARTTLATATTSCPRCMVSTSSSATCTTSMRWRTRAIAIIRRRRGTGSDRGTCSIHGLPTATMHANSRVDFHCKPIFPGTSMPAGGDRPIGAATARQTKRSL